MLRVLQFCDICLCNCRSSPDTTRHVAFLALTDIFLVPNIFPDITDNYTKCPDEEKQNKVWWSNLMSPYLSRWTRWTARSRTWVVLHDLWEKVINHPQLLEVGVPIETL